MAELPMEESETNDPTIKSKPKERPPNDFQRLAAKYGDITANRIMQKIRNKERGAWRPKKKLSREVMAEMRKERVEVRQIRYKNVQLSLSFL